MGWEGERCAPAKELPGSQWAAGLWAEVLAGYMPGQACPQVPIVQGPSTFCFGTSRFSYILLWVL